MHNIQQQLLQLIGIQNIGQLSLREIGKLLGESSPQKIKHHLQQLEKRGLIRIDKAKELITVSTGQSTKGLLKQNSLLRIPILGAASAGPATTYAAENIEGYLRVSKNLIERQNPNHRLYALKVSGPSMNKAMIGGRKIEDGDYVIIDSDHAAPKNNDVVLSIIDGMANIKKFYIDSENNQILLMSDSTQDFPAIHIHPNDDYTVNGVVVGVIKKPKVRV